MRISERSREIRHVAVKKDWQLLGIYLGSYHLLARCSQEVATPSQGELEGSLSYVSSLIQVYTWLTVTIIHYLLLNNFRVLIFVVQNIYIRKYFNNEPIYGSIIGTCFCNYFY